jgi:hypothetical protein
MWDTKQQPVTESPLLYPQKEAALGSPVGADGELLYDKKKFQIYFTCCRGAHD